MKRTKLITLIIGVISLITSFILMLVLNIPTTKEEVFRFNSTYKTKEVSLEATYYEKKDSEYAVLICPGYSCDRQKWRPFADLFLTNDMTTMVFDYSGQGASYGTIGFDNAKTDAIPVEIDDALQVLHEKSGIAYENIILFGHSMGGRSILRLLNDYNNPNAETTVTKKNIGNVILFSPEVNYNGNAQASLFAGTSDLNEYPWKDFNETFIQGTNVYLFGSSADDVVNDKDILKIYSHLGGTNVPESGSHYISQVNSVGSKIVVGTTSGVLHSYQMYSPEFADFANKAITDIKGSALFVPSNILMVYFSWGFGLVGIFLTLFSLNYEQKMVVEENIPTLQDSKKFLLFKLLMWLPGLLVAFLVCSLCVVMPFGSPIMNIPYMCFIAGYGILMLFLYRKGTFKGTIGKLPKPSFKIKSNKKDIIICITCGLGICLFVWYILRGSMYRLVPFNFRLIWLLIAGALMGIGYYISGVENDMLKKANASKKVKFLYSLIQYVPLFLFALFYLVIGSYSGLIGQVQNLILMYIFCIPIGEFIKTRLNNRLYGAVISALLFQGIMITSAALISFF